MNDELLTMMLEGATLLRLGVFTGVLLMMAVLEQAFPRRRRAASRPLRWVNNLALVFLNSVLVRLLLPVSLIGFADIVAAQGWGLFNLMAGSFWLHVLLSLILLDLAIYLQHRLLHAVPALWRLHRLHHADLDYDTTTGLRFHPLEILLSMIFKFALVVLLGVPAVAVLVFEVVLNGMALFNHANVNIPAGMDRFLRAFVVTPDFHRVHHSIQPQETNSNFGFNLSCWDRLFRSYRPQPEDGHLGMTIGLAQFREMDELRLDRMLGQPFR